MQTQYIASTQTGRSAALNLGLRNTRTRFVAVTDDDCSVDPDWLPKMTSHLVEAPDAVVTGRVLPAGEKVIVVVTSPAPAVYRRPQRKFSGISGGNMGTSMSVITRVGLFDEDPRLRTAEDKEWTYRALRAGVPIIYVPDIVVHHYGWRSEEERVAQYRDYARSHGGFYGKYLRRGDVYIALRAIMHYLRALRRWLRGAATGDQELVLHGWAYLTGLLPGIVAGLREEDVP
jgi:GT2 family glycosyltransferase